MGTWIWWHLVNLLLLLSPHLEVGELSSPGILSYTVTIALGGMGGLDIAWQAVRGVTKRCSLCEGWNSSFCRIVLSLWSFSFLTV